jgi:hypothetical protein
MNHQFRLGTGGIDIPFLELWEHPRKEEDHIVNIKYC